MCWNIVSHISNQADEFYELIPTLTADKHTKALSMTIELAVSAKTLGKR